MTRAEDFESYGVVDAVRPLVEQGWVDLYCLDSSDGRSWYRQDLPFEDWARLHEAYERWVVDGRDTVRTAAPTPHGRASMRKSCCRSSGVSAWGGACSLPTSEQ